MGSGISNVVKDIRKDLNLGSSIMEFIFIIDGLLVYIKNLS